LPTSRQNCVRKNVGESNKNVARGRVGGARADLYGERENNLQFALPGHWSVEKERAEEGATWSAESPDEALAVAAAMAQFEEHAECFADENDMSCLVIDIADARAMGIMPLREPSAE
jgi:hypothetical protein